jgi:hypothetical protein
MRRRHLYARAAAFVVVGASLRLAVGCATASTDPGVTGVHCGTSHDCGPSSGGDGSVPDTDELPDGIGFDTPHLDTSGGGDTHPGDDTTTPPVDTGSGTDTLTCTIPTGKTCGWIPQCGCAAGQNCDFTSADGTVSCVAAGTVPLNGKCTKIGQCGVGLTCIGAGICVGFCNSASDCSAESGSPICQQIVDASKTPPVPIPGYKVCMQQCDLRAPAGICGSGTGCGLVDTSHTTCVAAGSGTTGASCDTDPFSCAPGLTCVDTGTPPKTCLAWCRVGFSDCTGGLSCLAFSDHPTIGGTEYGVCD